MSERGDTVKEYSRWWRVGTLLFGVANIVGAIYHVAIGEMTPAMIHGGVAAGSFLLWMTVFSRPGEAQVTADMPEMESHIDNLQRSVDAIALEVERIGEGQRFAQKILEDRRVAEHEPRN